MQFIEGSVVILSKRHKGDVIISYKLALRYRRRYEKFEKHFAQREKTFQHVFQLLVPREEEGHDMFKQHQFPLFDKSAMKEGSISEE